MARALVLAASCAATSELAHAAAGGHPHSLGSLGFVTLALVLPMFGVLRRPSPVRMTSAMVGGQLLLHLVWTALDAPVPNRSLHTHHGMQTVAGHAAMTHPMNLQAMLLAHLLATVLTCYLAIRAERDICAALASLLPHLPIARGVVQLGHRPAHLPSPTPVVRPALAHSIARRGPPLRLA